MYRVKTNYIEVAPLTHIAGQPTLTYQSDQPVNPGDLVEIPLGRRTLLGVITAINQPQPAFATKPIKEIKRPGLVPPQLLELAGWLSQYYLASLGRVWQTMLPTGVTRKRRAAKPQDDKFSLPSMKLPLTPAQTKIIAGIENSPQRNHLLYGVTGAGKTQIYLELARKMLASGRSVIVLVPEIALTPQIIAQFEAVFGEAVIANHSGLTESQRHRAWENARASQQPRIVIGPRSSLFLPVPNLGLVVIDECHETSYKQEQAPRYHALAVAAKLAAICEAKLVLGSATPGVNEVYLAQQERLQLWRLDQRIGESAPPKLHLIDLRDKDQLRASQIISQALLEALIKTKKQQRQSLLFLNRRGTASTLLCSSCGWVAECPNCQLPLTFHADVLRLICHHCNFRQSPPAACPSCHQAELRYLGIGTKRLEAEITQLIPGVRLARLDRDSAKQISLDQLYQQLHAGEIDILIGTQMIAKGLDLPLLDTVGIISADSSLYLPDFTASERTYQLISQVSGRSGRRGQSSNVYVQTFSPDHPAIRAALEHDYWGFAAQELAERKLLGYPPYRYLLKLTVGAKQAEAARAKAAQLAAELAAPKVQIVGPAPAFHEFQAGTYRWQIIAKSGARSALTALAASVPHDWTLDIDPVNLL